MFKVYMRWSILGGIQIFYVKLIAIFHSQTNRKQKVGNIMASHNFIHSRPDGSIQRLFDITKKKSGKFNYKPITVFFLLLLYGQFVSEHLSGAWERGHQSNDEITEVVR